MINPLAREEFQCIPMDGGIYERFFLTVKMEQLVVKQLLAQVTELKIVILMTKIHLSLKYRVEKLEKYIEKILAQKELRKL